jgi:hypothetical protein
VPAVASKIAPIVAQIFPIVLHVASIVLEILAIGLQVLRVLFGIRLVTGFLVGLEIGLVARDVPHILILVDAVGSNVASIAANVAAILLPVVLRHHRS